MSIRVLADGADGYRLFSPRNELVGWVRGRVVGVNGFASQEVAIDCAVKAYRVLAPWLERRGLQPLPPIGDVTPRLVHDGAHKWIACDRVPVARLPEDAPIRGAERKCHSFEIVLRGAVSAGMAIHAALIAVRAAHGRIVVADIAWPRRGIPSPSRSAELAAAALITHSQLED
jgi:hypothetical protein